MKYFLTTVFILMASFCLANTGQTDIVERMPNLVMQLGVIIFFARIGALLAEKCKIPGVLGELLIGIVIGPYLLGSIALPGFPYGLFGSENLSFPIQPELYGIAIIASIILLFLSGLETDISLFLKFSFAATVIGISGIVFSYFFGAFTASYFLKVSMFDPKCMFLGIMSTATSVGITARILSEQKKMDTPEGVTIIAGAVIDDVLGVVLFAIVLGVSLMLKTGDKSAISWSGIGLLAFKEISIWLGVTLLGLYFAHRIGGFLKKFKSNIVFSVIAFSLALIIAGLFERAGLAMIIGAYVVGFSLSKTEISVSIQESLHPLKIFFVPIFFTVMGMLVDVTALFSVKTLIFGAVYTLGAIISKLFGCGLFALFLNFNMEGAKRIGLGMIPRGEVALIIASIGLSYGFLNDPTYDIFSIAILMTLITTLISPPLLAKSLKKNTPGVRSSVSMPEKISTHLKVSDPDLRELICQRIIKTFKKMGFFISKPDPEDDIYQIRKDRTIISLHEDKEMIELLSDKSNTLLVKRILNESINLLDISLNNLLSIDDYKSQDYQKNKSIDNNYLNKYIKKENMIFVNDESKEGVIWELLSHLKNTEGLENFKSVYYKVMERELNLSTGLRSGIAIPHTHLENIDHPLIAIGISKKGIDFHSIDNEKTYLIMLLLSEENDADLHIAIISEFLKAISNIDLKNLDIQTLLKILVNSL